MIILGHVHLTIGFTQQQVLLLFSDIKHLKVTVLSLRSYCFALPMLNLCTFITDTYSLVIFSISLNFKPILQHVGGSAISEILLDIMCCVSMHCIALQCSLYVKCKLVTIVSVKYSLNVHKCFTDLLECWYISC